MAFDFKKEYKEFYMPKNKPEIVNVPKANYIAVRGKGNLNEKDLSKDRFIMRFIFQMQEKLLLKNEKRLFGIR